jgi:hypothetical protein
VRAGCHGRKLMSAGPDRDTLSAGPLALGPEGGRQNRGARRRVARPIEE